jgi:hypothetical protein
VTYTINFTFEEYTKDNQDYLLVIDSKMVVEPQSVKFYVGNFFKDKILNDAFNHELTHAYLQIIST